MRYFAKPKNFTILCYALVFGISMSLCALVNVYYYRIQISGFFSRADASSLSEIQMHQKIFHTALTSVISDIRLLADNQIINDFADQKSPENRESLVAFWRRMMMEHPEYDQIRFLCPGGMEAVRLEYNDRVAVDIPKDELSNKSERYYYKESAKLRKGRIYISPIDVNHENGVPELPFKPTIRFGVGVYDSKQQRAGTLVINFNVSDYLNTVRESSTHEQADFMLLTHDGYWIMHPDKAFEWGQFKPKGKGVNFAMMYPDAWDRIKNQKDGEFVLSDQVYDFDTYDLQDTSSIVSTRQTLGDSEKDFVVEDTLIKQVALLPASVIQGYRKQIINQCLMITLVWIVLSLVPCWGLARTMVNYTDEHRQLSHNAHHDNVTGLANRVLLTERMDHAVSLSARHDRLCAVLYIDLDGFKPINDQYGHHIGDELLQAVAARMLSAVRKTDTVARIGGDEFAILLSEIKDKTDAMLIGEKVMSRVYEPVSTSKGDVTVGASIGVALFPENGTTPDALLEYADRQMYGNKRIHKEKLNLSRAAS